MIFMNDYRKPHMKKLTLLLILTLIVQLLPAQNSKVTEEIKEFKTYPFSDPNPIPLLTGKKFKIYPYFSFDGYSLTSQMQKWKVITLENDYIKVFILPEIGGKVWGAIEKSTGKEFIYNNDVVKFRNIAMRGPWTSGGIENNFGIIGHTPATAAPVDYITKENPDGSVSCIIGNIDLPSRTQWRVEIRLPKDKAYFETIPMWDNPTPIPQSYYCFLTGAAAVTDDLEFFYPGDQSLEHEGMQKTWPMQDGHLKSIYPNNKYASHTSIHIVGEYNDFMGGYYHKSKFGFGHWALYNDMPGRKLWLWALSREGEIWKDLLTDTHGQYMEFQAGRSFNQYSQSSFRSPIKELPFNPGVTDRWKEIWFPVKEIGGLQEVSPMGVLNVTHEKGILNVGLNALAFVDAKLIVKSNQKVIYSQDIKFKPMDVFKTNIPLDENAPYDVIVEGMDLKRSSVNLNLIKRPFVTDLPANTESASSYYQEGIELKENRNYRPALVCFKKCLQKDPLYLDAMVALSELNYRSCQYDSALYFANQVLQINAYHPAANYFTGITYRALHDLTNALETLGWAARSLEFRSAAYAQMAGVELQLNDLSLAEHYANQALDFNRYNFNALKVLTIKYRKSGEIELANRMVETMITFDPLNHFADFERYRLHPSDENLSKFTATIKNEFPYQTYLELAIDYSNLGSKQDALMVLEKSPNHPLVTLWKAYLSEDPTLLNEVTKQSAAFVFPYRSETLGALKWAMQINNHWKFKYYRALNLWAVDRVQEATQLFTICGQEPDFAPFYSTRATLYSGKDKAHELADRQKAKLLDPSDWRNWNSLIDFYENIPDNKTALQLSSEAVAKFKGNFNLELQFARVQLNNAMYNECINTLEKTVIIPFEGSVQGKFVYEQAYIFQALDLIKKKKFKGAIAKLEKSKEWPENLGVGKPYDPDNRMQDYLEAICLDNLGRGSEATKIRDAIADYTLSHYDYFRPSFNNLLGLMILQKKGETEKANSLVKKIKELQNYSSPVNRWVVAYFGNDSASCTLIEKELIKNQYFKIVEKLQDIIESLK